MRSRNRTGRYSPPPAVSVARVGTSLPIGTSLSIDIVQRRLCLGSTGTELAGETGSEPTGRIRPKRPQPSSNLGLGEPGDLAGSSHEIVGIVGWTELHRSGTVVTDLGAKQRER